MISQGRASVLVASHIDEDYLPPPISSRKLSVSSDPATDKLTPREKISLGIDPVTNGRLPSEQWHTKLVMMSATREEYQPYVNWAKSANQR